MSALRMPIDKSRQALRAVVERSPFARRVVERMTSELARSLDDDEFYSAGYFGSGRNPLDREGTSGYERYDRETSNANVSSYMVWKYFQPERSLDVGCAAGYVVEALGALGYDAYGSDLSTFAMRSGPEAVHPRLRYGNLLHKLPAKRGQYDLITIFETLEHLPPTSIPRALKELRRVCSGYVIATIPSFGPNPNGRRGWFEGKVRDGLKDKYYDLGPEYRGPIPPEDLNVDANGDPLEGHLTIASFQWWTEQFEAAGFVRCDAVEKRMNYELLRLDMLEYWDLYAFKVPGRAEPGAVLRSADEIDEVEDRFGLAKRAEQAIAVGRGMELAPKWGLDPRDGSL